MTSLKSFYLNHVSEHLQVNLINFKFLNKIIFNNFYRQIMPQIQEITETWRTVLTAWLHRDRDP